ncbi:hypothetical protein Pfo_026715 [Paulownia fortunei]|nr:hypothetical protein Pfo_026715 [Paulownia fortunei]
MEESLSCVKFHSRKRKKSGPSSSKSNPLIGILTRSKSRIYFHHNRSGIYRPDPVPRKPISFRPETESVEAFLDVNCNNASRVSSIKDLRMRRVFTPDVNSVLKEEEEEDQEENEEGKKLLKGSDAGSDSNSDVGDAKVDELEKPEIMISEVQDERNDMKNGLTSKDQAISGNGSLSKSKMALNRCGRRKVFKTWSSFSYRRLLPYLMDIVNDDSSVANIEIVDAGIPCKLQKLHGVKSEVRSIAENSYTAKVEHIVPQFDDTKPSENEDVEKFHTEVTFNQQDLSGAEHELDQTAEIIRLLEVEQKGHENDVDRVDASVDEECGQMTPPDPGIFPKTEVGHGGESMEANNMLAENQIFKGLSGGSEKSNGDVLRQSPNSNRGTNSINRSVNFLQSIKMSCKRSAFSKLDHQFIYYSFFSKELDKVIACRMPCETIANGLFVYLKFVAFTQVLNPYSRLRLFKNPRSLSYRRLLPFLMDISKNNSCASRITQHPMPQVDLKEDLHPVSAAIAEQNYVNKTRTKNFSEKKHTEDRMQQHIEDRTQNLLCSMVPLPPSDGSSPDTSNSPVSSMPRSSSTNYSSNVEPSSATSESLSYPCMLIDLQTEGMPQSQSNNRKLDQGFDGKENSSALPPSSIINNDILTKLSASEELGPVGKQKMCLDMGLELHNNNGESIEKVNLNQSAFQVEVSDPLFSPTNGLFKGILKRNRRGCRGLCNCLNCASFRLHADRAFEFSRNQMHDAEEVASELMKELANLRLLLEKSIINDIDLAAIQLNPVLVKQACHKALETENLAKERLSQLNYDLNVHCRIPTLLQPKVTFANYIQERAIPVLDPSTSTEKKG